MNKSIVIISFKSWNCFIVKVWSFFINIFYWIRRFRDISNIKDIKDDYSKSIKSIDDIRKTMIYFKWKKDSFIDWHPWIITLLNENIFSDDCDGAAIFAKWLFKQINIKSDVYILFNDSTLENGHAVCVTRDNKYIVSNNIFIDNTSDNKDVLKYFPDRYNEKIKI